jgi:hypothetical protein
LPVDSFDLRPSSQCILARVSPSCIINMNSEEFNSTKRNRFPKSYILYYHFNVTTIIFNIIVHRNTFLIYFIANLTCSEGNFSKHCGVRPLPLVGSIQSEYRIFVGIYSAEKEFLLPQ